MQWFGENKAGAGRQIERKLGTFLADHDLTERPPLMLQACPLDFGLSVPSDVRRFVTVEQNSQYELTFLMRQRRRMIG